MIKIITVIRKIERLRRAINSEGTPKVQEAWDELEPHVSVLLNAEKFFGPAGKDGAYSPRSGDVGGS